MAIGLLAVAAVVVVGAILLALVLGGGRSLPWVVGILGVAVLAAVGVFFLRAAPPRLAVAPAPAIRAVPGATGAAPRPGAPEPEAGPVRAVRGRVLKGAAGAIPFPDAVVEARPIGASPDSGADPLGSVKSGPDGRFNMENLPAADLRLRAAAPGQAGAAVVVEADDAAEVTLRLVPGTWVSGKVLDAETRSPVAGATVSWADSSAAKTAADGGFRLEPVPADRATLSARARGYARTSFPVRVPPAGRAGVEILLRPGASVAGTVFGPDGKPVPGARVEAASLVAVPVVGDTPIPLDVGDVRSGPDGKYLVADLPCGRGIRLSAGTDMALSDPVDAAPLEKGEVREGVDLRLTPGGAVLATVVDEKGGPVAGASVTVSAASEDDGDRNMAFMRMTVRRNAPSRTTDERGFVRIRPVEPGPVKVRAAREDYRDSEQPLVTGAGTETPVTLVLNGGTSVSGRVVDPAGAGVPAARVTASRFGGGAPVMESRTAGEDGTFRVGGLDGRAFQIRAEKEGFVPASLNNVDPGTSDLLIALQPGGAVAGVVTDASGAPVRKFRINTSRQGENPNPMDWQRFSGQLAGREFEDPEGRFRVDGLEPGTFTVEARAADQAPGRVEGVVVEAARDTAVAVTLSAGLTLSGVVVRKGDGSPVAGAKVKVPAEGILGEMDIGDFDLGGLEEAAGEGADQARQFMAGMAKAQVVTGPDGRFLLRGLEAGALRLAVSAKGLAPAVLRGVDPSSSQEVRVELAEESAIEGVVSDARGAPKPGAFVMLQRFPAFMRFASTDAQGRYRIEGVPAGSYLFYVMEQAGAMGAGLNMKSESVTLEEAKTLRKDHRLGEGTKVAGRITRGGKPVSGVMVMLVPASRSGGPMGMLTGGGGGGFSMGSSKEDGTYEITGVAPGRYTVSVQAGTGGAPSGGEAMEVARGVPEVRHDIAIPESGIRGIVVDEEGKPVRGAAVTAVEAGRDMTKLTDIGSAMEAMGGQTFSDDQGRFQILNMKAGTFHLQAQAQGYGTERVEGVSSDQAGAEVRIVLKKGMEVTVRVVGPDGAPVAGAGLYVTDSEGRELSNLSQFDTVRTGADGRAVLRVPPGNLRFEAVAKGFAPGETAAPVPAASEVVVRLSRGAALKVTVRGSDGQPLAGAGVELLDPSGAPLGQRFSLEALADLIGGVSTGADGTWTRRDLPAGAWKVRAALPDGRSAEERVSLAEGETTEIALQLR